MELTKAAMAKGGAAFAAHPGVMRTTGDADGMQDALRRLLDDLDEIGDDHGELFDTHVREAMGEAIFLALLKSEPRYILPDSFGLFSPEGDARVRRALEVFLRSAAVDCIRARLNTFHERLAAFQDSSVVTDAGNDFEEFFGWTDPDLYDEVGNLKAASGGP